MVETKRLRAALAELAPGALQFLTEMISHASTHGNERAVLDCARARWQAAVFEVEEHPIPDAIRDDPQYSRPEKDVPFEGRHNLLVREAGTGGGRSLILNSHLDVVPAGDWPEAFEPRLDGEEVRGRGACDAKGCVAAMFLAAHAVRKLGLAHAGDLIYQMVIDEEVGGNGTLALIREGVRADGVLVLEPTGLMLHPANRGAIWFRFEFEGLSCHMGRKHEGINALDLACETMGILYEYEKELIRDQDCQPLFAGYEFPAQVNVGMLSGGDHPSTVAGRAVMEGGVGFLPNRPMERVKEDLVRYIQERGSRELKERYRLSFPKLHNDSYETPPDHPFVQACRRAAELAETPTEITGWNVSCDARLFGRLAGLPTVVFGPGRIEHAHSAAERITTSEITRAAEVLVRLIELWCSD